MNRNSWIILVIIAMLLLIGLSLQSGEIILVSIPFLVYMMIGILQIPNGIKLAAKRTLDKSHVSAQESVGNLVSIENRGCPLENLSITDPILPSINIISGVNTGRIRLLKDQNSELSYRFTAQRGAYTWDAIQVTARDPLNLFGIKHDIPAPAKLLVSPAPMFMKHVDIVPRYTIHSSGPVLSNLSGTGTDFLGVREYRTGDSLRHLNWKLIARHQNQLFTKSYEQEEIANIGILLDARRLTGKHEVAQDLFELSISAATSMSELFIKEGNRVGVLVFGQNLKSLFPGYGKKQHGRITRILTSAELGAKYPFSYFAGIPPRLFPKQSVLFIFSCLDPEDLDAYSQLHAVGYTIILISPNPIEYGNNLVSKSILDQTAARMARIERGVLIKHLMNTGIGVIDWDVKKPLSTLMQMLMSSRAFKLNQVSR